MIINPIIPIWLMTIISVVIIILIIYSKQIKNINKKTDSAIIKQSKLKKDYIANIIIEIIIVILLFVINLRFMLPNGENTTINSDLNILFVIDTSVSMRALDYNGSKERFEGVVNDCCHIVDELSNAKFSIITFGDMARKVIPFTTDTDMVQAELKSMVVEDDHYANGTSMNLAKDITEKTLKKEIERKENNSNLVVFFVSDGEITKKGEKLDTFSNIKQYVSNGAVLGYGTLEGGKMVDSTYVDNPTSEYYYKSYYEGYKRVTAISKIDEDNLKQIAADMGIDYIQMSKTANIDYKIKDIKNQASELKTNEKKSSLYKDTYFYFAIPLVILLILDFINQKRRMQ